MFIRRKKVNKFNDLLGKNYWLLVSIFVFFIIIVKEIELIIFLERVGIGF